MQCMRTVEYYSAFKRKEILKHGTTWTKMEDIISETSKLQKEKIPYDSTYKSYLGVIQFTETEGRRGARQGLGRKEMGHGFMGTAFSFYKMRSSGDWLPDNVNIFNTAALYS